MNPRRAVGGPARCRAAAGQAFRRPAGGGALKLWRDPAEDVARALEAGQAPAVLKTYLFESAANAVSEPKVETFFTWMEKGGPIGYITIGLGFLAGLFALLRVLFLFQAGAKVQPIIESVTPLVQQRRIADAIDACKRHKGSAARVVTAALRNLDREREHLEDIISESILHESTRLNRFGAMIMMIAGVAPLLGLLGGMVSSTATTLNYARHAHEDSRLQYFATNVIVLANLTIFVRLVIIGSVVSPDIARPLITMLGTALVSGLLAVGLQLRGEHENNSSPEIKNPTELGTALTFGLIYAVVLFCSAWLNDIAGSSGIYLVALASGLTDVDAITLSSLRLYNQGRLPGDTALIAIALAVLANTGFKLGLILSIGGWPFAKRCAPVLLIATLGLLGGLAIVVV